MRIFSFNRYHKILIFKIFLIMLLQGCATLPKERPSEESLRIVAEEYWKLRLANKCEDIYKMEDPAGLPPFTEYCIKVTKIKKFAIKSYSIKEVVINPDTNRAIVNISMSFRMPPVSKPFTDVITDEWLFKDGKWWHILSDK